MRYKPWSKLRLEILYLGPEATGYWSLRNKRITVVPQISLLKKTYVVLHELGHASIDLLYGPNKFGLCSIRAGSRKMRLHAYYDYICNLFRHTRAWFKYQDEWKQFFTWIEKRIDERNTWRDDDSHPSSSQVEVCEKEREVVV